MILFYDVLSALGYILARWMVRFYGMDKCGTSAMFWMLGAC